jgi:hypothetical protein
LPCTAARQRLCRADLPLCRAFRLHGKALFCRSDSTTTCSSCKILGRENKHTVDRR